MNALDLSARMKRTVRAVAAADAFALPMLGMGPEQIRRDLGDGDLVRRLCKAPPGAVGSAFPPGAVSDVFAAGYLLLRGFLSDGGHITAARAGRALLRLKTDAAFRPYFDDFLDPVTREGLERLDGSYVSTRFDLVPCDGRRINCSAAARAWVAGLLNPGDPEAAIRDAVTLSMPTHPNAIAISGAAVSAALTAASFLPGFDCGRLYELALKAARDGYELGLSAAGMPPVGAKLPQRIELAVNLALRYRRDPEKLLQELNDVVGFGAYASEAVPSAVGLVIAAGGRAGEAVRLAANAGNCACCTAVIAAAACAASSPVDEALEEHFEKVRAAAPFDWEPLWAGLTAFAELVEGGRDVFTL
ncbi:ADP-ribosylglycohydrolase family protein [Anaerofilum sp. BX8]|uniref:ADP-ribosylglycohydrolase family protein n=1 Tax=Anaerofilum hominis TaxID=2763016 RepID=A0A923L0Z8_9FIRM|nr:ADP-ribosylglycohydrolase family protein [Anaerofilum hominis]MBC5581375.1 ADP-ribosylglycohydrolase family protein [Anaerofilum hominis]